MGAAWAQHAMCESAFTVSRSGVVSDVYRCLAVLLSDLYV